jgi:hypothetical protein
MYRVCGRYSSHRDISSECSATSWGCANKAKVVISTRFNSKQQVFLDCVLSQYVKVGVQEL